MRVIRTENPALKKLVEDLGKLQGQVGWDESAQYPDGKPVAKVAAIQEYGAASRSIPPRPFMRPTLEAHGQEWADAMATLMQQALDGGQRDARSIMDMAAELARGDVQKQLAAMGDHPEDSATVYVRRHRNKPPRNQSTAVLRDTLLLFNTLTAEVVEKGAA